MFRREEIRFLMKGSEANAVTRIWKKYGVVPAESYTGLLNGRKYHNHEAMVAEMRSYLESLKSTSAWDEESALDNNQIHHESLHGCAPDGSNRKWKDNDTC